MKKSKYLFFDPHDGYSGAYMPPDLVFLAKSFDGKILTLDWVKGKIKKFVGTILKVEIQDGYIALYSEDPTEAFKNRRSVSCWRFLRYKKVSGKKKAAK